MVYMSKQKRYDMKNNYIKNRAAKFNIDFKK